MPCAPASTQASRRLAACFAFPLVACAVFVLASRGAPEQPADLVRLTAREPAALDPLCVQYPAACRCDALRPRTIVYNRVPKCGSESVNEFIQAASKRQSFHYCKAGKRFERWLVGSERQKYANDPIKESDCSSRRTYRNYHPQQQPQQQQKQEQQQENHHHHHQHPHHHHQQQQQQHRHRHHQQQQQQQQPQPRRQHQHQQHHRQQTASPQMLPPQSTPELRVLSRHIFYLNFSQHNNNKFSGDAVQYINVIRDPVARCVSRFYYERDVHGTFMKNETLDSCMASGLCTFDGWRDDESVARGNNFSRQKQFREECSSNYLTRWFCGMDDNCHRNPLTNRQVLERAKATVADGYEFVGITARMSDSFKVLQLIFPEFFGGDHVSTEICDKCKTTETSPTTAPVRRVSPANEQILARVNKFDVELFEFTAVLFELKVAACLGTK